MFTKAHHHDLLCGLFYLLDAAAWALAQQAVVGVADLCRIAWQRDRAGFQCSSKFGVSTAPGSREGFSQRGDVGLLDLPDRKRSRTGCRRPDLWDCGDPIPVYCAAAVAFVVGLFLVSRIRLAARVRRVQSASLTTLLEGFRYIRRHQLILGSISLDLFAVLLGGAVALLPVYAREILNIGAYGLGVLRSAPSLGAVLMAITVAHFPLRRRAGRIMLMCVFGFGVLTVVFGISRNFVVSLAALVLLGACDMISVIVRQTLVQISTPDDMRRTRRRVSSSLIGASNELGGFESGVTAQWFGTVPAVVLGGIGTMVIVALWSWLFPELRRANRLVPEPAPGPPAETVET